MDAGVYAARAPAHLIQRHGCGSPAASVRAPAGHAAPQERPQAQSPACASACQCAHRRGRGPCSRAGCAPEQPLCSDYVGRRRLVCCALPGVRRWR